MPVDVLCAIEPAALESDLKQLLRQCVVMAAPPTAEGLIEAARGHVPDLIVVSPARAPRALDDWIREVRELPDNPDVVLIHDREDPVFRAAMLRAGCLAVLNGRLPLDDLAGTLQALIQRRNSHMRLALRASSPLGRCSLDDFVSESPRMQEFVALARQLVDADTSLLLLGETGTGKERLARAIHEAGPRAGGPFVAVNCGALPEHLLESELFGHEKGAFTGAVRARKGYFEQADGGTVFLDEIAEVPLHLQVKLLRVIERRQVQRVGGERSFPVDARVMAATNRDLHAEVAADRFRRDLYYRLAVVTLGLPPLRERCEDVATLFQSYVEHFRLLLNKPVFGVCDEALLALTRYEWPGNVRELINVAERAVLLGPGPEVRLADLPRVISWLAARQGENAVGGVAELPATVAVGRVGASPDAPAFPWLDKPIRIARRDVMQEFERDYLTHLLRATDGRIGASARRAGINERSLYELLQRHHLRKEDFRS